MVSFREPEAHLDQGVYQLAQAIHSKLVPETSHNGIVDGADLPLTIYTMLYLRGMPCLDALTCRVEMDGGETDRHMCFIRHRRCLSKPQDTITEARTATLDVIQDRLALVRTSSSSILKQYVPVTTYQR